jgi:hypothetical protein
MHIGFRIAVRVGAFMALAACYDPDLTDPTPDAAVSLVVGTHTGPADGETLVTLAVRVPPHARGDDRNVTFTASLGFLGNDGNVRTVTANADGSAVTDLRAPVSPGLARIRATVAGVIREDTVRFTAAFPERVVVEPQTFTLQAGATHEIPVAVTLWRSVGMVSAGAQVTLAARRADTGEAIGQFSTPAPSGASGIVSVRFTAGDTSYRGAVVISASHGESGVSGRADIRIID